MTLVDIAKTLRSAVADLTFSDPVSAVYNPIDYAWKLHETYLARYGRPPRRILLIGMNPGPFGMAQTGVPFGDPAMVKNLLRITGSVGRPDPEHPKRPIAGLASTRREVSGTRLWSWVADRFGTADAFFAEFFVGNYCPLVFLEASGRNRTPDKLPKAEREPLFAACDEALCATVDLLKPELVIGIGRFAEQRIRQAVTDQTIRIASILHPSPANPKANRDWAGQVDEALARLGVQIPEHQSNPCM